MSGEESGPGRRHSEADSRVNPAHSKRGILIPALVILFGLGSLYPIQRFMDRTYPRETVSEESLYFASGKTIKKLSLGLDGLMADIYWIRTVQYFGRKLLANQGVATDTRRVRMDLLAPLLDIVVALDKHDIPAYRFGALFLPDRYPDQAIQLLNKGIENNPQAWRLYQDLGYIYWHQGQFEKAAETYDKGSRIPGARWFMRDLAGLMRIRGGSRETARVIYSQYLDSDDKNIQHEAVQRLKQLDSMDQLDFLNELADAYKRKYGECPTITTLGRVAASRGMKVDKESRPLDPNGFAYVLDASECRVGLDPHSTVPR